MGLMGKLLVISIEDQPMILTRNRNRMHSNRVIEENLERQLAVHG